MCRKEHNNSRRTSARETECTSRLGVPSCDGFQRLATSSRNLPQTSGEFWPIYSRFVCITNECPTSSVLQLETRSSSSYSGCSFNFMEKALPVHVSTICLDPSMLEQAGRGENISSSDSTSLDESSVVPSTSKELDRSSNPSSSNSQHFDKPTGYNPPNGNGGSPTSGCMACLRRSYRTEGLSEGVIEILRKSWRTSTETAYSSAWRQWDSWCFERSADPFSAPVNLILEFLFEQFNRGKQYCTINTIRSAISMTHEEADGTRVGQHPLVSRFLKGVFNSHPPAPRYSVTWDVDVVLSYLKSLPINSELSFQALSHKLAMLMALANADRCSDLAAL